MWWSEHEISAWLRYLPEFADFAIVRHCWSVDVDCLLFELPTWLTRPVEAFSLPPMIQSHGHKIAKSRRGGRRRGRRTRAGDDDDSIHTQGEYMDWIVHWKSGSPNGCILFQGWTCIVRFIHTFFHYDISCYILAWSSMILCVDTLSDLIAEHYLHSWMHPYRFYSILCGEPSKTQSWRIVLTGGSPEIGAVGMCYLIFS